jgi:hypothetical protein
MNQEPTSPASDATPCSEEYVTHSYPSSQHCIPLWPCPLCGTPDPIFIEHITPMVWTAECTECGLSLGHPFGYGSRLDICRDWNRRSPLPQNVE